MRSKLFFQGKNQGENQGENQGISAQIPALVLGSGVTALGVLRCLGRVGIQAFGGFEFPQIERWSKWYQHLATDGLDHSVATNDDTFYQLLRKLDFQKAVIIPCSDSWAAQVSGLPEDLQQRFVTAQPEQSVQQQFLDKQQFGALLDKFKVPHPQTFVVENFLKNEVDDWSKYFLKPRNSQGFFKAFGKKAHRVTNAAEANTLLEQCRQRNLDCILQEYIPGKADRYFYVEGYRSRKGQISGLFARRRLRMYPPDFGNSSAMISIPLAEVDQAQRSLCRLLEGVNYQGIFSAEFKMDSRDGQSKLLEVNTRPWWYVEFASACGLNVPWMYYCDALGLDLPLISPYREGKKGVYWYYDWQVFREGQMGNIWSALRFWLSARHTVFVSDDPLPALGFLVDLVKRKFRDLK